MRPQDLLRLSTVVLQQLEQLPGLLRLFCYPACEELWTNEEILECELNCMNNQLPLALSLSSEASLVPPEAVEQTLSILST